jgi:hypothetical protein
LDIFSIFNAIIFYSKSEMADTVSRVLLQVAPVQSTPHNKVTIVGVGQVGMACAYSILQQVSHSY